MSDVDMRPTDIVFPDGETGPLTSDQIAYLRVRPCLWRELGVPRALATIDAYRAALEELVKRASDPDCERGSLMLDGALHDAETLLGWCGPMTLGEFRRQKP